MNINKLISTKCFCPLFLQNNLKKIKWASFVYLRYFLETISIVQIEKSVDGVLGIQTQDRRMVGADETTELLLN